MNEQFHWIDLVKLHDHPQNPRLIRRDDVINAIAAGINGSFDPAHALIVRPLADGYQVVSGHNRKLAAKRQDLKQVPCWVRELDDDAAYMLLLTSNNQGELTALERGLHALRSVVDGAKLDVKAYAAKAGRARQTVQNEVMAARVANAVPHVGHELVDRYKALVKIHAAPQWLWPALVEAMVGGKWTVEDTRTEVARLKELPKVLAEWAASDVPAKLIAGQLRINDFV